MLGFPGGSVLKNLPANSGDSGVSGSMPGLGRSAGVGNGIPFQYFCQENSTDKELMRYSPWGHKESDATDPSEACHVLSLVKDLEAMWLGRQVLRKITFPQQEYHLKRGH